MAFYTFRTKRRFFEQLRSIILIRWFLYLNVEDSRVGPVNRAEFERASEIMSTRRNRGPDWTKSRTDLSSSQSV